MRPQTYPFSAIVGQEEMKLALLLAAVDWRISVLLRGDKGSGKTTTARALADLLPAGSRFLTLPIGTTEDRLLGGLDLERALKGESALKPGLLSEAHGGVLYVDEVNLLPAHLGDMLLDAASSGINVLEREGFSASHAAEFVLLGSMNPEEGSLRPQLLDRFALAVDISAPMEPDERRQVVKRRIEFERDPVLFVSEWSEAERELHAQVAEARGRRGDVACPVEILAQISQTVCDHNVRSLRADLAVVRAAMAYAALTKSASVEASHVAAVLPLVLAHRASERDRRPRPQSQTNPPLAPSDRTEQAPEDPSSDGSGGSPERVFSAMQMQALPLRAVFEDAAVRGSNSIAQGDKGGPIVGRRRTETPKELDLRASLQHAVLDRGDTRLHAIDLHERVRRPSAGTRYLLLIDSSGSHAAQERMRLVKGAASGLLARSFRTGDEVVVIAFRGTSAQVLLEPTRILSDALAALEYLPTGGRTPLAHGLEMTRGFISPTTILILLTDGRANVSIGDGDPWREALAIASELQVASLVIDTEVSDDSKEQLRRSRQLADQLEAKYVHLDDLESAASIILSLRGEKILARG